MTIRFKTVDGNPVFIRRPEEVLAVVSTIDTYVTETLVPFNGPDSLLWMAGHGVLVCGSPEEVNARIDSEVGLQGRPA